MRDGKNMRLEDPMPKDQRSNTSSRELWDTRSIRYGYCVRYGNYKIRILYEIREL